MFLLKIYKNIEIIHPRIQYLFFEVQQYVISRMRITEWIPKGRNQFMIST